MDRDSGKIGIKTKRQVKIDRNVDTVRDSMKNMRQKQITKIDSMKKGRKSIQTTKVLN